MIDLNRMGRNEINDYVVYKIVCLSNPDLVYVGSTANFYNRRIAHKTRCNNPNDKSHNSRFYLTMRENGGWENWNMVIIDEQKQLTLIKSRMIEEEWRLKLNANLNSIRCFTTDEEKKEQHKYTKEHYERNQDNILKKQRERYEKNKDTICEKQKEYREKNKDIIRAKSKEYYEKNRENILKKDKVKVTCVCGCVTNKSDLPRHMKTPKHLDLLAQQTTEIN